MISVYVDLKFNSGNLSGITLNRYHLYDIPKSTRKDTEWWLRDCVAYNVEHTDLTGNKYQIFDYHLEEKKDEK